MLALRAFPTTDHAQLTRSRPGEAGAELLPVG
jgi:hypothetical protein